MAKRITTAQRKEVARLTGEGATVTAIAEAVGISVGSVKIIRKRIRATAPKANKKAEPTGAEVGCSPKPSDVSDSDLAAIVREALAKQVRDLSDVSEAALSQALGFANTGEAANCRNMIIAYGVAVDKLRDLVRTVKELAPSRVETIVRQRNSLEPNEDDGILTVH